MIRWTRVAGVVRIDGITFLNQTDWKAFFGKEVHFDSPNEVWDDANENPEEFLPYCSEGSLTTTLWTNPNEDLVAAYTLSIFGDLRDYDTPQDIIDWFKKKIDAIPLVRQAVITAELEFGETLTWTYQKEDKYD